MPANANNWDNCCGTSVSFLDATDTKIFVSQKIVTDYSAKFWGNIERTWGQGVGPGQEEPNYPVGTKTVAIRAKKFWALLGNKVAASCFGELPPVKFMPNAESR